MTETEAQDKSQAKVSQIHELAAKLQIRIIAQQIIKGNVIENSVCFIDQEKYDIDKPAPVVRGPNNVMRGMPVNVSKPEDDKNTDLPK